jgi:hypothetical protein
MRFFIGALALLVICVVFASPAVFLFGLVQITSDRKMVDTRVADPAPTPWSQAPR